MGDGSFSRESISAALPAAAAAVTANQSAGRIGARAATVNHSAGRQLVHWRIAAGAQTANQSVGRIAQPFSNCGTRTTGGTIATARWYN